MHSRPLSSTNRNAPHVLVRLVRLFVFLLPLGLLVMASLRQPNPETPLLWLGVGAQALACLFAVWASRFGRESSSTVVILLYVIALACLIVGAPGHKDWLSHVSRSVLLVIPVVFFALQCLRDSGATTIRRARSLAARLSARKDWPADLMLCRFLPEVKALRECLHLEAAPALDLLADPRPALRVAALSALEYRLSWRPGQSEFVQQLARRALEPEVRAAALNALANIEDRRLIESLGELLRDRSPLVRQIASEALLWNSEHRWHWLRDTVRQALNDPNCESDGPLRLGGNVLTRETLNDLHAWCAEKGLISYRSALTLGAYYGHLLVAGNALELPDQLRRQLLDPSTPAMLRVELARLLTEHNEITDSHLRQLLPSSIPTPVRLIAAERLLANGQSPEAAAALHELARLPNREIALATAEVVQRSLGYELGVPRAGSLPPVYSPAAADIARRLLVWANQTEPAAVDHLQESRILDREEYHVEL